MKSLIALLLFLSFAADAQVIQQPTEQESSPPADADTRQPAPRPGTPEENVFKPSEEVSADKEVDFPADL